MKIVQAVRGPCSSDSLTSYRNAHLRFYSFANTLRPRQNGRHFRDNIFKCIFLNENVLYSNKIHWSLFLRVQLTMLLQIMAWHRSGDKPLSERMMVSLLMHICITQPQWVNLFLHSGNRTHFSVNVIFQMVFFITSQISSFDMLHRQQNSNLSLQQILFNNVFCCISKSTFNILIFVIYFAVQ